MWLAYLFLPTDPPPKGCIEKSEIVNRAEEALLVLDRGGPLHTFHGGFPILLLLLFFTLLSSPHCFRALAFGRIAF